MAHQHEPLPSAQPVKSLSVTDQRGFTLAEVVVALLVCTVGLVGMAQMLAVTLRMQQLGRNSTSAVRMAQDKIDELSSMSFLTGLSVQCGGSLTTDLPNYNDVPAVNGQPQPFRRRWLIQAGPDADPQLRQVTVRIIPEVRSRTMTAQIDLVSLLRTGLTTGVTVCP
jgi:prepilin-type N-terminal cleavage/methylation domain-containing protein